MKKFFKILNLFLFCLQCIYSGNKIKLDKYNIIELWKYCERWERGEL